MRCGVVWCGLGWRLRRLWWGVGGRLECRLGWGWLRLDAVGLAVLTPV